MSRIFIPLFAFLAVILQTTLVPQIAVAGIAPDLIFLLVIFLALQRQTTLGLWTAFCVGLVQDIAGGGLLGLNAMLLVGLAYLALYLRQKFFQENLISQILIIIFFTFLHQFATFFWMNTLLHTEYGFSRWLIRAMGMSLYQVACGPLLFKVLKRFVGSNEITRSGHPRLSGMRRIG